MFVLYVMLTTSNHSSLEQVQAWQYQGNQINQTFKSELGKVIAVKNAMSGEGLMDEFHTMAYLQAADTKHLVSLALRQRKMPSNCRSEFTHLKVMSLLTANFCLLQ